MARAGTDPPPPRTVASTCSPVSRAAVGLQYRRADRASSLPARTLARGASTDPDAAAGIELRTGMSRHHACEGHTVVKQYIWGEWRRKQEAKEEQQSPSSKENLQCNENGLEGQFRTRNALRASFPPAGRRFMDRRSRAVVGNIYENDSLPVQMWENGRPSETRNDCLVHEEHKRLEFPSKKSQFGAKQIQQIAVPDSQMNRPWVVTIVRAEGCAPHRRITMLLNRRAVQTFEQLLGDISEALGLSRWRKGHVRRLYTLRGKEARSVSDFFRGDEFFIATSGKQPLSNDELQSLLEELFPENASNAGSRLPSPSTLNDVHDNAPCSAIWCSKQRSIRGTCVRQASEPVQKEELWIEKYSKEEMSSPKEGRNVRIDALQQMRTKMQQEEREGAKRWQQEKRIRERLELERVLRGQRDETWSTIEEENEGNSRVVDQWNKEEQRQRHCKDQCCQVDVEEHQRTMAEEDKGNQRINNLDIGCWEQEQRKLSLDEIKGVPKTKDLKIKSDVEHKRKASQKERRQASSERWRDYEEQAHNSNKDENAEDGSKLILKEQEKIPESKVRGKKGRSKQLNGSRKQKSITAMRPRPIVSREKIDILYEIGRTIGHGNFAVVKECRRKREVSSQNGNWELAIKIVHKAKLTGHGDVLESEVELMSRLRHPNVVRLIEVLETTSEAFLVMEYVRGGDLFDAIAESVRFTERHAAAMVRDLCQALFYLHNHSVAHRDIKPENLLMQKNHDGSTTLKLADFGLAVHLTGPVYTVCGTPTYVAPEILTENGYGLQVDMWATGVIAYILLCGFPPFRSIRHDQYELFDQIQFGQYEFVTPFWDHISNVAKQLIQRLLVIDPSNRYTAREALQHPWTTACDSNDGMNLQREVTTNIQRHFSSRQRRRHGPVGSAV
uniref:serine/threonine-protein kinase DCLK3-like n=1 Tax=Myxine glutinosa TaxID=7769 RepID=UPI00358F9943